MANGGEFRRRSDRGMAGEHLPDTIMQASDTPNPVMAVSVRTPVRHKSMP